MNDKTASPGGMALASAQQFEVGTQLDAATLILGPAWERIQAFGKMMARGNVTIPKHLQGNESDCAAIAMMAIGWRMNPYAVAQKTHVSQGGQLGYEAQLVNAVIQASGELEDDPNYEYIGDWSKVLGKVEERKSDKGGKYYVATYTKADEQGLGVIVRARLRGEAQPRALEVMMSQAWPRFSTQWATDPKQQISYLALRKFVRLHKPGVILGVNTHDEIEPAGGEKFMGPADVVQTPSPAPAPKPDSWPDDLFALRLPEWHKAIAEKRGTVNGVIARAQTKYPLTEAQFLAFRYVPAAEADATDVAAKGAAAQAADAKPAAETKPSDEAKSADEEQPVVTYAVVADRIAKAGNNDQLSEAADLIGAVANPEHRTELAALYEKRRADLTT